MQVWAGKVKADTPALQGTQYAQWGYTIFNFNSFAEAILTLFQLNVISNYNSTSSVLFSLFSFLCCLTYSTAQ